MINDAVWKNMKRNDGLVRPLRRATDPDIGSDSIMAMIPSDLALLVKLSGGKSTNRFDMDFFNLYRISNERSCLSLSGPFLGSPQAVMGLERLIALGAKRVWVLGWCGSLRPDLRIGDLVIPSGSFSEEGTSGHYPIGKRPAETDHGLNILLEKSLRKRGIQYAKGPVWTTDAPYRETPEKIREYREKGALTVEMELSALMTVSIYCNIKLAGLLVVSDELFDLKWNPGFSSPRLKMSRKLGAEVLLDSIESINH